MTCIESGPPSWCPCSWPWRRCRHRRGDPPPRHQRWDGLAAGCSTADLGLGIARRGRHGGSGRSEGGMQGRRGRPWQVRLSPLSAPGPYELTVAGKNRIVLKDVLVGEVWLASGQSNMAMAVKACNNAAEEIAAADYPKIRLFSVPRKLAGLRPPTLKRNGRSVLRRRLAASPRLPTTSAANCTRNSMSPWDSSTPRGAGRGSSPGRLRSVCRGAQSAGSYR